MNETSDNETVRLIDMLTCIGHDITDYADTIEDTIAHLNAEAARACDSVYRDDVIERVQYLRIAQREGARFVDNDVTASPSAWKYAPVYTPCELLDMIEINTW